MPNETSASAVASPTPKSADPLKGLHPGRVVYFFEGVINRGIVPQPAVVVDVHRDGEGKRTGECRLFLMYTDGSDGTKPAVKFSEKPKSGCWSWPQQADGTPNLD